MPGVVQCEIIAQASCVLFAEEMQGKTAYYAGIDKVRFRRMVRPGDTLEITSTLLAQQAQRLRRQGRGARGWPGVRLGRVLLHHPVRAPFDPPESPGDRRHKLVSQTVDRQPRRDRRARHPRLQGDGHLHRGGVFRGRPRRSARVAGGRERLHRPGQRRAQLSEHARHTLRRGAHRRAGHPSRLRPAFGKRALCRALRAVPHQVHRPLGGGHPPHGRQGRGPAHHARGGRARRARLRPGGECRSRRKRRGGKDRLSRC